MKKKGQAVIEIGIFGAIVIFLIGAIIRTHVSLTQAQSHQIKAMKLALLQSFKAYNDPIHPNSSHNSTTVLFIEDRLSPDLNKFGSIERTPFIASGSGTMTNRLLYTIDAEEVGNNLPIMDVFINGQHFPLTTAAFVFRPVYQPTQPCPDDSIETINGTAVKGQEYYNCQRQQREWAIDQGKAPLFFSTAVNGTVQFSAHGCGSDLSTIFHLTTQQSFNFKRDGNYTSDPDPSLYPYMAWQWCAVSGDSDHIEQQASSQTPVPGDGKINFGTGDQPAYPSLDISGSLHEQTIYKITYQAPNKLNTVLTNPLLTPYKINGLFLSLTQALSGVFNIDSLCLYNPVGTEKPPTDPTTGTPCPSSGPITGAAVLDSQLGDINLSFDPKTSQGGIKYIGLLPQMGIYTWVGQGFSKGGTYLEIREGKLYNPETHRVVRSISRRDHVDLISHMIQLSNNTGRFCQFKKRQYSPVALLENGETNPVEACGDCAGQNLSLTCFDPLSRILYVRSRIADTHVRKWFTDVTKGL